MHHWNVTIQSYIPTNTWLPVGQFFVETEYDVEPTDEDCMQAASFFVLPENPALTFATQKTLLSGNAPAQVCFAREGLKMWFFKAAGNSQTD